MCKLRPFLLPLFTEAHGFSVRSNDLIQLILGAALPQERVCVSSLSSQPPNTFHLQPPMALSVYSALVLVKVAASLFGQSLFEL